MKGKKILAFCLAAVLLAGSTLKASAAGVKDVFDADYYAGRYSDLKSAYGTDEEALLKHFLTHGVKEGRVMNPILDIVAYRAAYADLDAAFGDDWNAYVAHYLTYGIAEKRTSGVMFDLIDYANVNPDVREAYGDDYLAIARHYMNCGIKEGRHGGTIMKKAVAVASRNFTGAGTGVPAAEPPIENTPAENESVESVPAEEIQNPAEHIHNWGLVDFQAATCTENGYHDYRCQDIIEVRNAAGHVIATMQCPETMREVLNAAHTRPENVVYAADATCSQPGLVEYDCTVCGEARSEEVPPLGHVYDKNADKPVESKSSTCMEAGYDIFICRRCSAEIKEMRVQEKHTVVRWIIDKKSSCTEEGIRHGRCSACGSQITENTGKTDHMNVVNINVFEDAYLSSTWVRHSVQNITYCKDCGYIFTASEPSYVNCADAGNGRCGTCDLEVKREVADSVKVYQAGESYHSAEN